MKLFNTTETTIVPAGNDLKKKIFALSALLAVSAMAFMFAGCSGDGDDKGGNNHHTQFSDVGISTDIPATVNGALVARDDSEEGVIAMKWRGSDEESFVSVVDWLKENQYDKYDGGSAEAQTVLGGLYTMYESNKVEDGKTLTATAILFHQDYDFSSIMGFQTSSGTRSVNTRAPSDFINFKANDLYLLIETEEDQVVNPPLTEWPAATIQSVLGTSLPAWTGAKTSYSCNTNTLIVPTVTIFVNGSVEAGVAEYKALLTRNGFVQDPDEEEAYIKTLENSNVVTVTCFWAVSGVTVIAIVDINSGGLTQFPTAKMQERFPGVTIPAFVGASSFDVMDNSMDIYTVHIRNVMVTCYGVDEAKVAAYESALVSAGYSGGDGDYEKSAPGNMVMEISIRTVLNDSKIIITYNLEEEEEEELPYIDYTLPTNVKFVRGNNYYTYTVVKIGNDWHCEYMAGMLKSFFKHNNGVWTEYEWTPEFDIQVMGLVYHWEETGDTYNTVEMAWKIEGENFLDFMDDTYMGDNFVKNGTETIAGKVCDIWVDDYENGLFVETKWIERETGLVFKETVTQSGNTILTNTVTQWDTSVTSFADAGVTGLPE